MTERNLNLSNLEKSGLYAITFALAASTSPLESKVLIEDNSTGLNWTRPTSRAIAVDSADPTLSQSVQIGFSTVSCAVHVPVARTQLWRRLSKIRERAIEEGLVLLTVDELSQEVSRRRGEVD